MVRKLLSILLALLLFQPAYTWADSLLPEVSIVEQLTNVIFQLQKVQNDITSYQKLIQELQKSIQTYKADSIQASLKLKEQQALLNQYQKDLEAHQETYNQLLNAYNELLNRLENMKVVNNILIGTTVSFGLFVIIKGFIIWKS